MTTVAKRPRAAWRDGQNISRQAFRFLRRPFEAGVDLLRASLRECEKRLEAGGHVNLFSEVENLPWMEVEALLETGWRRAVEQVMQSSMRRELDNLGIPLTSEKVVEEVAAVVTDTFVEQQALSKAVAMTATTKAAVNEVLEQGLRGNLSIPGVTRNLVDIVGLTPNQTGKLLRLRQRAELERGLTGVRLDRFVNTQRKKMLRTRAEAIARTETIAARNRGQLNAWNLAAGEGSLESGLLKEWITSDPCIICELIADEGPVPMDALFFSPETGETFESPPAHVSCRCSMGLVRPQ